jgi:hypothetical protein
MIFVARSCNMSDPMYDCYPENPPDGKLLPELLRRAERTPEEVTRRTGNR